MDKNNIQSIFELTTTQKGMLFHTLKESENRAYVGQQLLYLNGEVNPLVFEKSLKKLAARYDIFRTRIIHRKLVQPVQVVLKDSPLAFRYLETDCVEPIIASDRRSGFSLEKENLIRITLIKTGEASYLNIWTFHHILIDGYSIAILAKDFFDIYCALLEGHELVLQAVPPYHLYLDWLKQQDWDQARAYRQAYVQGVEAAYSLPGDLSGEGSNIRKQIFFLDEGLTDRLKRCAADHQITLNALVQAIWGALLSAYNQTSDLLIGNVMVARPPAIAGAERMVGMFSATYPLRIRYKGSLPELARTLQQDFLMDIRYAHCTIGDLPEVADLIRTLYVFENFELDALLDGAKQAGIEIEKIEAIDHSNYEFSLSVAEVKGALMLTFRVAEARYSVEGIKAVHADICGLAEAACAGETVLLEDIQNRIQYEPRDTAPKVSDRPIKSAKLPAVQPTTETQKQIANLFARVLELESPGIYDDFFESGGDSIKGMSLVGLFEREGLDIGLKDLFAHSNIAELARICDERSSSKPADVSRYTPDFERRYEPFPLNAVQSAYLMGIHDAFEIGGFTTQYYMETEGDFDIDRLEAALCKVVEHQPALRTLVVDLANQRIRQSCNSVCVLREDIADLTDDEQSKVMLSWRKQMQQTVFDPTQFPYFKVKAFHLGKKSWRLCFLIECILVDGAGLLMLLQELSVFYADPMVKLPEIEFTTRDYQNALFAEMEKERYRRDRTYWQERAKQLPLGPEVMVAGDPEQITNPLFVRRTHRFSAIKYEELKQLCRQQKMTMAALLSTAYMQVLSFWSGSSHFSINMTVFERNLYHPDVARLIGDFTKLILVETQMAETGLLAQAQVTSQTIAEALEHSSYNCVNLLSELAYRNEMRTKAVLPYVFTCALADTANDLFKPTYAISRTPQVYLDCQVMEENDELLINWDYPQGLFDEQMIGQMFEQYVDLINHASDDPELEIDEPTKQFIARYNDVFSVPEEREKIWQLTLVDLFFPSFEKYAQRPALKDAQKTWDYATLGKTVEKTAAKLIQDGVRPGDCVCVMSERKNETIAAVLAILYCGAAYVPINIAYPPERIRTIADTTNSRLICDVDYVRTAVSADAETKWPTRSPARPAEPAYVIFTSGTTGQPKGVTISHRSAVNTILDINERCALSEADCLLCLADFGFDLSVYDIFGAFSVGAKLCLVEDQRNPEELIRFITEDDVTFWNSVPAVMQMLTGVLEPDFQNESMRHVYLSGDYIPLRLPDQIRSFFPKAEVTGLGGATEASIWSIFYPTAERAPLTTIPYGMPLKNQTIYILDKQGRTCPLMVRGEIHIGGDGVAMGYFADEERTAAAFIEHPDYGRLYRTGDYGRLHPEGYVEFLGRMDNQVKIRGFRVELGEIETHALAFPGVRQAVAVYKKVGKGASLILYLAAPENLDTDLLERALREKMPDYMVPSLFVKMDALPVSQNGKIDRKKLALRDIQAPTSYREQPESELEYRLGQVFLRILEIEQINYEGNFFEMGIDSLKAVMAINELKKSGFEITLTDIYDHRTISELALALEKQKQPADSADASFEEGEL